MSSKLIKQTGHRIELPNDRVLVDLKIYASGKIQLQAPEVSPADLCKLLYGIGVDVMFASLTKQEEKKIETLPLREETHEQQKET